MRLRQIGDLVDSLVLEGQRKKVHQQIERRQKPGEDAVAREIAIERGIGSSFVAQDIKQPAAKIEGEYLRNKENSQREKQQLPSRFGHDFERVGSWQR